MRRDFGVLNGGIDYKQLYSNYLFKYKRLRILVSKNPLISKKKMLGNNNCTDRYFYDKQLYNALQCLDS